MSVPAVPPLRFSLLVMPCDFNAPCCFQKTDASRIAQGDFLWTSEPIAMERLQREIKCQKMLKPELCGRIYMIEDLLNLRLLIYRRTLESKRNISMPTKCK